MSFSKDKRTGFSNAGFRGRRVNPDGSYPSVSRHLGFLGTVDLSTILATAKLAYRWDATGTFTELTIDLTAAGATPAATTVSEVVIALNADTAFAAVLKASADSGDGGTGRLKIADKNAESTHSYLELSGEIAEVLGFGQYGDASAMGTAFVECYKRSGAFTFGKQIKDGEEIEQESASGEIDTMVIDAQHKGINPSIAVNEELYALKVLLQGGTWSEADAEYTPPTSAIATAPLCAFEFFVPKYNYGSSHKGDAVSFKMTKVPRLTGREADVEAAVKSWAAYQFECMAREYVDVDGVLKPAYTEKELTRTKALEIGVTL